MKPLGAAHHRVFGAWLLNRSRRYLAIYCLILPTCIGMIIFNYAPKFAMFKYCLYRWDGGKTIEEFRGFGNFINIFTADPMFWQTFQLVGILLVANLIKMWPSIFTAIALHRIRNPRFRYLYRVLFVIPMVIPSLVVLLLWKGFFNPQVGILNAVLNATGLMGVLRWFDTAMPQLASVLAPCFTHGVDPLFGSVWGVGLVGFMLLGTLGGWRAAAHGWGWWGLLVATSAAIWWPEPGALPWRFGLTWAAVLFGAAMLGEFDRQRRGLVKGAGVTLIAICCGLILCGKIWITPTAAFTTNTPSWMGHTMLIIPSLLFWGFPWVGTIGVLIYLAGLQNIDGDVYEAAELDGAGPLTRLFRIELPLIMTQVRINLIFMTIGTLNDYGLVLVLFGASGGPGNRGMVPGLYMYREAFASGRHGYACALGMVLFAIILGITMLYQKYVRVEK